MPASSPSHSHIFLNVFKEAEKMGQKLLTVDHLKYNILILITLVVFPCKVDVKFLGYFYDLFSFYQISF